MDPTTCPPPVSAVPPTAIPDEALNDSACRSRETSLGGRVGLAVGVGVGEAVTVGVGGGVSVAVGVGGVLGVGVGVAEGMSVGVGVGVGFGVAVGFGVGVTVGVGVGVGRGVGVGSGVTEYPSRYDALQRGASFASTIVAVPPPTFAVRRVPLRTSRRTRTAPDWTTETRRRVQVPVHSGVAFIVPAATLTA